MEGEGEELEEVREEEEDEEEVEEVGGEEEEEVGEDAEEEEEPVQPPALWTASSQGRTEEVRRLLVEGAEDIDGEGGPMKNTPLCEAARRGHVEVLLLLLEHGAELSATGGGATPLHFAARTPCEEIFLLLIENGADISAKDINGARPIHWVAAAYQDRETEKVVQLLLDRGADVLSESNAGYTAEYVATACGHHQTAATLKAEALRRAQCEAFAMGHGERRGAGSRVRCLDPGVVRMVLERV